MLLTVINNSANCSSNDRRNVATTSRIWSNPSKPRSKNSTRASMPLCVATMNNTGHRYARIADVETKTNPIDRTVAHLLFHRPLELTGNYPDKLESPIPAKIQFESREANLEKFPMGCLPVEDLKSNQQFSYQGLEAQPEDQFKNSHCIDTSENASNDVLADAGDQVLEASP